MRRKNSRQRTIPLLLDDYRPMVNLVNKKPTFSNMTTDHNFRHSFNNGSEVAMKNGTIQRRLPNAIIIGVKKAGTRALLEYLRLHPLVKGTGPEIHFFDRNYHLGLEWYRGQMPETDDDQLTIEKTPSYFVRPEVPSRIYNMSRDTKLLIVVRNPVQRAISACRETRITPGYRAQCNEEIWANEPSMSQEIVARHFANKIPNLLYGCLHNRFAYFVKIIRRFVMTKPSMIAMF